MRPHCEAEETWIVVWKCSGEPALLGDLPKLLFDLAKPGARVVERVHHFRQLEGHVIARVVGAQDLLERAAMGAQRRDELIASSFGFRRRLVPKLLLCKSRVLADMYRETLKIL